MLIEVEGDFAVLVDVTGELAPGPTLPKDLQGNDIPYTSHGAGLLIYQDRDNFVRLERTAGVNAQTLGPIHKVFFEVVKAGKRVENHDDVPIREGPVSLLLMRRNDRLWCGASLDSGYPPVPIWEIELNLPKNVRVGLSACNISARPLTATFEHFAVDHRRGRRSRRSFGAVKPPSKPRQ